MSEVRRKISLSFLLLLLTISAAAQDDGIRLRSCRRGVTLATTCYQHAQETPRQPGGDFYQGDCR